MSTAAEVATPRSAADLRYPRSRYVLFAAPAIGGLVADLATKSWVFSLPTALTGHVDWLVPGYVGIQTALNEGALFGMGQGLIPLFAIMSLVAIIGVPWWLFRAGAAIDPWLTVALGGVFAGVLGNLYDRLGLHCLTWPAGFPRGGQAVYAVRDWILFQASDELRWPNFNLADALLVIGAVTLFWRAAGVQKAPVTTAEQ